MGMLRILLALSVFMAHTQQIGSKFDFSGFGGSNAVEIFFIVSGFYVALILDKDYSTAWQFYKNRALKLYPIYYIICFLVLIRSVMFSDFRTSLFSFPTEALILGSLTNLTFFGSDWLMFLQWNDGNFQFGNFNYSDLPLWHMLLVPQAWSLGIEVTFYLLAPILCKAKSFIIIIIGAALLTARFSGLLFGLNQDPWTYRFFPFEVPMFLMGIVLYRIHSHNQFSFQISLAKTYTLLIASYLFFPLIITEYNINRAWQMLILIILTSLIVLFGQQSFNDKRFGELSYPIYISHVLVISSYNSLARILSEKILIFEKLNEPLVALPVSLLLVFLTSYILLFLVKPIEKIRDKNRR